MARRRRDGKRWVYLDGVVITQYLRAVPELQELLEAVIRDGESKDGDNRLFTSALSITEVAYLRNSPDTAQLTPEEEELIERFWDSGVVTIVESNQVAMRHGRDLARHFARSRGAPKVEINNRYKSVDFAHLGTALYLGADEAWSYDGGFLGCDNLVEDMKVCEPWTKAVPRQLTFDDKKQLGSGESGQG